MANPFSYGGIVSDRQFCNRVTELRELVRAAKNKERLFIHGERRVGKTSLLKSVMSKLREAGGICFYIDVWKCVDEADFRRVCASALSGYALEKGKGALGKLAELFSGVAPSFGIDESGKPTVTLVRDRSRPEGPDVEEILRAPGRISAMEPGRPVLVVFDEFQQIREISGLRLEKVLRSVIQEETGVAWFFCGSRATLLREMFLKKGSPLFRSSGHYPVGAIGLAHWRPFITGEFDQSGKKISPGTVKMLVQATGGHPFYTQMLCSALWDISGHTASESDLEAAVSLLLDRESGTYATLWNSLPDQPRKMLRAIALEGTLFKPTSGEMVRKYGFSSPSTAKSALLYLLRHDHASQDEKGGYHLSDRFLAMWCLRNVAT